MKKENDEAELVTASTIIERADRLMPMLLPMLQRECGDSLITGLAALEIAAGVITRIAADTPGIDMERFLADVELVKERIRTRRAS